MDLLLFDLGGTNSRFVQTAPDAPLDAAQVTRLKNDDHASFAEILRAYFDQSGAPAPRRVVIALAAPIAAGDRVRLTNRDWCIDKAEIARISGADRVDFINDFEALGHALQDPDQLDHTPLTAARTAQARAPRLVLGAGTGFNSALWLPGDQVLRCEAGHAGYAAESDFERALAERIRAEHGRCSVERVLSGGGIEAAYRCAASLADESPHLQGSREIVAAGLSGEDEVAARACRAFTCALGRVAGDLALLFLPRGGIYLFGGATQAMRPLITAQDSLFLEAFHAKGRMRDLMEDFPIHLLDDDRAALQGALNWARL
ncbi:glucokinase [Sulfitobacter aestuarii]|uniref:Glucokinase n=1 Tax=Sulfitobacter aestuarii TaxID=2161676 RepID=A0ABW5U2S7_9RHOB